MKKHWKGPEVAERLQLLAAKLMEIKEWNEEHIESILRSLAEELQISAAKLIHPTRLALSGRTATPGLFEIMAVLGQDEVESRIKKAVEIIRNIN